MDRFFLLFFLFGPRSSRPRGFNYFPPWWIAASALVDRLRNRRICDGDVDGLGAIRKPAPVAMATGRVSRLLIGRRHPSVSSRNELLIAIAAAGLASTIRRTAMEIATLIGSSRIT